MEIARKKLYDLSVKIGEWGEFCNRDAKMRRKRGGKQITCGAAKEEVSYSALRPGRARVQRR